MAGVHPIVGRLKICNPHGVGSEGFFQRGQDGDPSLRILCGDNIVKVREDDTTPDPSDVVESLVGRDGDETSELQVISLFCVHSGITGDDEGGWWYA